MALGPASGSSRCQPRLGQADSCTGCGRSSGATLLLLFIAPGPGSQPGEAGPQNPLLALPGAQRPNPSPRLPKLELQYLLPLGGPAGTALEFLGCMRATLPLRKLGLREGNGLNCKGQYSTCTVPTPPGLAARGALPAPVFPAGPRVPLRGAAGGRRGPLLSRTDSVMLSKPAGPQPRTGALWPPKVFVCF